LNVELLKPIEGRFFDDSSQSDVMIFILTNSLHSQQQSSYEPSKEDLDALESLKTQFHAVCDELYLNLVRCKTLIIFKI